MTIAERIPTSTRGRWAALAGVAAVWVLAYWVNGWLWGRGFYDLFGMAPADRLRRARSARGSSARPRTPDRRSCRGGAPSPWAGTDYPLNSKNRPPTV